MDETESKPIDEQPLEIGNGVVNGIWFGEGSPRTAIAIYLAGVARRFVEMDAEKAELYRVLGIDRPAKVNRKTLREEWWYVWVSYTRRAGAGKYSRDLPWSPNAIEARKRDPKAPLVIEHVEPFTIFCERLEKLAFDSVTEVERALTDVILVVVTKEEDQAITRAGFRETLPPGSSDPWERYAPAGLTRDMFRIPSAAGSDEVQ